MVAIPASSLPSVPLAFAGTPSLDELPSLIPALVLRLFYVFSRRGTAVGNSQPWLFQMFRVFHALVVSGELAAVSSGLHCVYTPADQKR
jgi:hypothetical protein